MKDRCIIGPRWVYVLILVVASMILGVGLKGADYSDLSPITQGRIVGIIIGLTCSIVIGPSYYIFSEQGIDVRWAMFRLRFFPWDQVQQIGVVYRRNQKPALIITFGGCKPYDPQKDYELFKIRHPFKCIVIGHKKDIEKRIEPYCSAFDFKARW